MYKVPSRIINDSIHIVDSLWGIVSIIKVNRQKSKAKLMGKVGCITAIFSSAYAYSPIIFLFLSICLYLFYDREYFVIGFQGSLSNLQIGRTVVTDSIFIKGYPWISFIHYTPDADHVISTHLALEESFQHFSVQTR